MPRYWKGRKQSFEWDPRDVVSEAELLNRVILAKALFVHCAGKPALFRTLKEEFEITPRVAEDIIKASGQYKKKRKPRAVPKSR